MAEATKIIIGAWFAQVLTHPVFPCYLDMPVLRYFVKILGEWNRTQWEVDLCLSQKVLVQSDYEQLQPEFKFSSLIVLIIVLKQLKYKYKINRFNSRQ